jgi:hypothetical protein
VTRARGPRRQARQLGELKGQAEADFEKGREERNLISEKLRLQARLLAAIAATRLMASSPPRD